MAEMCLRCEEQFEGDIGGSRRISDQVFWLVCDCYITTEGVKIVSCKGIKSEL
jgi:hypothetical protein